MGRFIFPFVLFVFASDLWSQLLDVRLDSGRDNFVLDEQVIITVSIRNNSDQHAILANEKKWIQFTVSHGKGIPVAKHGNPPEGDVFVLKAGEEVEREFRLDPYFDFTIPSEYVVSAHINIPNWGNKQIGAVPERFQVMRGQDVAVLERGVSKERGGIAPEVHRYTLQKARVNGKLFMYLRVSDNNSPNIKVYNVLALGMMIQMPRPNFGFEIDASGIVHVFFQCHARSYLYCIINPAGNLIERKMYAGDNIRGRPRMQKKSRGGVEVYGGQRVLSNWDYPTNFLKPFSARQILLPERPN